jgi:hypothetical protein
VGFHVIARSFDSRVFAADRLGIHLWICVPRNQVRQSIQQERFTLDCRGLLRKTPVKDGQKSSEPLVLQGAFFKESHIPAGSNIGYHAVKILDTRIKDPIYVPVGQRWVASMGLIGVEYQNLARRYDMLGAAIPTRCGTAFHKRNDEVIMSVPRISMHNEVRV